MVGSSSLDSVPVLIQQNVGGRCFSVINFLGTAFRLAMW